MSDAPRRHPAPLREFGGIITTICALLAAGAFVLATYATVKTDNELGTVAAFVLGFLFAVTAMLGRVPYLKFGGSELDPRILAAAVVEGAEEAAETATEPEEVAEAARAVLQRWGPDPAVGTGRFLPLWADRAKVEMSAESVLQHLLARSARTARDRAWGEEKEAGDTDRPEDEPGVRPDEDVDRDR